MADATITPGFLSTNQIEESVKLAARRHLIRERRLSPEEARELWTFGGDAEALALFQALRPTEQKKLKAQFLGRADQPANQERELQSWLESIDQGGWPSVGELRTQLFLDTQDHLQAAKKERRAKAKAVKLAKQRQIKATPEAQAIEATLQADAAKVEAELKAKAAPPAKTPMQTASLVCEDLPGVHRMVDEKGDTVEGKPETTCPHVKLAELKQSPERHTRAVKAKIRHLEAKIRNAAGAKAREQQKLEERKREAQAKRQAEQQKAAEQLAAKRERNAKHFGCACSNCGYGLKPANRWVPPIEEMKADLGRDVQVSDLEDFVRCGACADQEDYPLAATRRVLEKRDIRRAQRAEERRLIEADRAARAAKDAKQREAERQAKAQRDLLRLKSRGRYSHGGPIRNADTRRW